MNLQTALVLIPAGIALYSAIYHLFLHGKARRGTTGHLSFAMVCITIAFYDMFSAGVYSSHTAQEAVQWQRNQIIALSSLGVFLIWFFSDFIHRTTRKLDWIFTAAFTALAAVYILDRTSLTFADKATVKTVELFGRTLAVYNEMAPGGIAWVQTLLGLAAIIYIFASLIRHLSQQPDSASSAMLLGFSILSVAVINDAMVAAGCYEFFYLIEYSFIFLAVSMAYALACKQMNLETDLVKSEEKIREILNSVPDIIYALDSRSIFTSVNDAAAKLLGYPVSQIIGRHFLEFVHPEDKLGIRDRLEKAVAHQSQKEQGLRFRMCNCDGEPIWVALNSRMMYNTSGRFLHEKGVIRDIRKVKDYEEELQQLAAAVNQADESIIITDKRGIMEYVNPFFETMTGYSRDEVIGKNTSILKSGKHNDSFYTNLWSTLKAGRTWRGHFTNRKKDGTLFDENAVISPIINDEGKILHYVAVKRDVTQEITLESQLRESQKMEAIGRLAGGIAHDFTNALVIILNSAQIAKKRIEEDKKDVHELLDQIVAASEKTSSLTSQLLAFSHTHQISPRVMNLNKVIAGIDTMIQRLMGSRADLKILPADYPIFVKIDPSQIEQILIHLSVNANDAMPDGGCLTITTSTARFSKDESVQISSYCEPGMSPSGDMAVITVTDSGCGMPQDILSHIFEPFFTTKGRAKSTGLGLSTVYAIARKHGGCADVYSNPGFGTTFRIYLPLADGTDVSNRDDRQPPRGNERIMVIEDNMVFRRTLVHQLKMLGYSVLELDDAKTAISSFQQNRDNIDLVISDLILPNATGMDIAAKIRNIKPDIRILFASAYPRTHLIQAKHIDNTTTVLSKPFSLTEVAFEVRRALTS